MKPYFISKENFNSFEKQLPEKINTGKGSIVHNKEGEPLLYNIIQKELSSFQHNSNNLQLFQKAIIIDWGNNAPSDYTKEECSSAIQSKSQTWDVFPLKKSPANGETSIYNSIDKKKLIGTALQSKLITSMPILRSLSIGVFIASLSISLVLFHNFGFSIASFSALGWSLSAATVLSYLFGIILKEGVISRQDISKVKEIIRNKQGCQEYKVFISKIATKITQQMPVAIIVEDTGNLDAVTTDVMDFIITSGNSTNIGAILWVVFLDESGDDGCAIFQKGEIPSKHVVMSRSISI